VEDLLKYADIAMYDIKVRGGGSHLNRSAGPEAGEAHLAGRQLAHALAIRNYNCTTSPKCTWPPARCAGWSASRWCDEEGHWISPANSFPWRKRGLINELGDWTLTQAARDIRLLAASGAPWCPAWPSTCRRADDGRRLCERAERLVRAQGVAPEA
jgi:EAL domain-containing protein (putative c-di-GMP-specific phosphodiesterase class I)